MLPLAQQVVSELISGIKALIKEVCKSLAWRCLGELWLKMSKKVLVEDVWKSLGRVEKKEPKRWVQKQKKKKIG